MTYGGHMNSFFMNKTMSFIKSNGKYSEEELLKIEYGMEGIFLTITKVLIILLIGIIFKYLDTVILTLLFFNILRFFAFGLHAKKSWQCLIVSIIQFNILPYILINISVGNLLIILIGIFSSLSFLFFAPSDTEKRPLTNKKKRIVRKVLSIITAIIFTIVALHFNFISEVIVSALLIESFMVNPLSYKMLGLKYNNYKKKEVKA